MRVQENMCRWERSVVMVALRYTFMLKVNSKKKFLCKHVNDVSSQGKTHKQFAYDEGKDLREFQWHSEEMRIRSLPTAIRFLEKNPYITFISFSSFSPLPPFSFLHTFHGHLTKITIYSFRATIFPFSYSYNCSCIICWSCYNERA